MRRIADTGVSREKSSEESTVSLIIDMLNGEGKKFCTGCAVWIQRPGALGWSKELFCRGLCMRDLAWCLLWYLGTKVLP